MLGDPPGGVRGIRRGDWPSHVDDPLTAHDESHRRVHPFAGAADRFQVQLTRESPVLIAENEIWRRFDFQPLVLLSRVIAADRDEPVAGSGEDRIVLSPTAGSLIVLLAGQRGPDRGIQADHQREASREDTQGEVAFWRGWEREIR